MRPECRVRSEKMRDINEQWQQETWSKIQKKVIKSAARNIGSIPYTAHDGKFDNRGAENICWWTNGFWPGILWLVYAVSGEESLKARAEECEVLMDRAFYELEGLNHDVGMMWHISSGVNYRLTGNPDSKRRNLYAANILAGRFNIKGNFIKAWDEWGGEDHRGWTIIDCMMNLPLLYWASEETKDPRYTHMAVAHADMAAADHIRPDGSVRHIAIHDDRNGGMIGERGGQGYDKGSVWSRGQAWAIYGFILSFIHTRKQEYLDTAKQCAQYFIAGVQSDWLPRCDFRSPGEPVIYDSTAGAIAACGLLEIAGCVPEYEAGLYRNAAVRVLKAMDQSFCNWDLEQDSILQMGTEQYHGEKGRHIPIIYGDYFFIEAIYKLTGQTFLFW